MALSSRGLLVATIAFRSIQPRPEAELEGLVYGATKIPEEAPVVLYKRPGFWAVIVGVVLVALNIVFW